MEASTKNAPLLWRRQLVALLAAAAVALAVAPAFAAAPPQPFIGQSLWVASTPAGTGPDALAAQASAAGAGKDSDTVPAGTLLQCVAATGLEQLR